MRPLRKIIYTLIRNELGKFILAISLYVFSAFLAMAPAKILQIIIDDAFLKYKIDRLLIYLAILLLVYFLKTICSYSSNKRMISLGNELLKNIKKAIYNKLMYMDLSFYTNNDLGYINSRIEEIDKIDVLFSSQTLTLGSSILEFVFAIIMLSSINFKMLIIFSIPIPVLCWYAYSSSKRINHQIQHTLESAAEYSGKMQDTLHGMEEIKSQGTEEKESRRIDKFNRKALDTQKQQSLFVNKFGSGIGMIGNVVTVLVYLIGGLFFINKELSMGTFVSVSTYVGKLYSPILSYASISVLIQPAFLSLKRVSEFFFKENAVTEDGQEITGIYKIEFQGVSFQYKKESTLLKNINLTIHKGDKMQLTGENGSGKSTLLRLIVKTIKPIEGKILVNDIDLNNINKDSFLKQISYIPQKRYLFNESVFYNVTYGIEDVDKIQYNNIVNELGLRPIVDQLERSGNNKIGENGSRLSGGEIQKICIARALLQERSVVILDEATTSLDKKAYAYIQEKIKNSASTWIIIDHQHDLSNYGFKCVDIFSLQGV